MPPAPRRVPGRSDPAAADRTAHAAQSSDTSVRRRWVGARERLVRYRLRVRRSGEDQRWWLGQVAAEVPEGGLIGRGPGDNAWAQANLAGLLVPQQPVRGVQPPETA